MPPTIDLAFVEEYNADVHLLYRQRGSRLQNTTRKGMVQGSTVRWQTFGMLAAQGKTRNAQHTFLDPDHAIVQATMADKYVPTLIDDLDLLKLNIEEKQAHAMAHVSALGKEIDSVLIATMEAGANSDLGNVASALDYGIAMNVITTFMVAEVPDDGNRFCAVHPYAWSQLLQIPEFANADYVGQEQLPFKGGMTAKFWMGILWMPLPNISWGVGGGQAADVALNLAWHRSAVGHGVNKEIETIWDYENTYSAWSAVSAMSMGAAIIEDNGCYTFSSLSPQPS